MSQLVVSQAVAEVEDSNNDSEECVSVAELQRTELLVNWYDLRTNHTPKINPLPIYEIMALERKDDNSEEEHHGIIIHLLCFNFHLKTVCERGYFTKEQIFNAYIVYRNGSTEEYSYLLQFLLFMGNIDVLDYLMGLEMDYVYNDVNQIIDGAIYSNKVEVIEWIVNMGIDVHSYRGNLIQFLLELAIHFDIIKYFFNMGVRFYDYDEQQVRDNYDEEKAQQIFELLSRD